jgi:hypothetical protein
VHLFLLLASFEGKVSQVREYLSISIRAGCHCLQKGHLRKDCLERSSLEGFLWRDLKITGCPSPVSSRIRCSVEYLSDLVCTPFYKYLDTYHIVVKYLFCADW